MYKILIIDDEKPTLSMFKLFLSAYGYEVTTAENGEEGLKIFEKTNPDIIFTDLKMPGIDGLEVLKNIRCSTHLKQPEVIIITGHGDMDKALQALDLDASDFINKPVEKEALDSALQRAEQRIKSSENDIFALIPNQSGSTMALKISGKLTDNFNSFFDEAIPPDRLSGLTTMSLIFDDSFSINKKGLYSLMNVIATIRNRNIIVTMSGLSYNHVKFFQMAGLHEITNIIKVDANV